MKIGGAEGEFGFKALKGITEEAQDGSYYSPSISWELSSQYFFSKKDAELILGKNIKWPVKVYKDGSVRVVRR